MARQTRRAMLAAVPVAILVLSAATGAALGLAAEPPVTGQSAPSSSATPSTSEEEPEEDDSESEDLDADEQEDGDSGTADSGTGESGTGDSGTATPSTSEEPPQSVSPEDGTTAEEPTESGTQLANPIVYLTNQARLRAGCPKLHIDPALTRAAVRHSRDMASNNYFSHTGTRGLGPIDRAQVEGYPSSYVSENVAAGNAGAVDTFVQWMTSAGHRRNILNCGFTEIGVAHVYQPDSRWGHYWTQLLGNPGR